MKTIQITDASIIQQIINIAGLQKDGFIINNITPVTVNGSLKYAIMKNLGVTKPNMVGVVLVSEISEGIENFKGIIGTLYRLRGSISFSLIAEQYTITCLKAYKNIKFESNNEIRVGKCTYNGKTYIGFTTQSEPSPRLFFSGYYTSDCIFTHVPESEVIWL